MKVITIGRSTQNDIVIQDDKVSRHHLQIILDDAGNYRLSDFGSLNGTYVNGNRVTGEVRLSANDVVRIGNTTLPWRNYFDTESRTGLMQQPVAPPPSPYVGQQGYVAPANQYANPQPRVEIPKDINVNKNEYHEERIYSEHADVRKRGDDFKVGFMRNMGDEMGTSIGKTLGCVISIIIIIVIFVVIAAIAH